MFKEQPKTLRQEKQPTFWSIADFDRDGKKDLGVANKASTRGQKENREAENNYSLASLSPKGCKFVEKFLFHFNRFKKVVEWSYSIECDEMGWWNVEMIFVGCKKGVTRRRKKIKNMAAGNQ